MSTSSASNLLPFTGISQYASDFQATLTKAVQVAQIPVTLLQAQDSVVIQKENALGSLSTSVASLAASLQSLGTLSANNALGVTSSNASIVSATNTGASTATSYIINSVTSVASAASERSSLPFHDSSSTPASSVGRMTLTAGSFSNTFDLTTNTLVGLRDQINSMGAGVTASILTTSGGNYLSITANSTGATNLQLIDDPAGAATNILTNTNQGADAEFHLNGIDVKQSGNVVNSVIPGLTFTILGQSAAPVTLAVQSDPTQLSGALQDFVTQYNALQTAIFNQVGPNGGPLAGDSVISQLQSTLRQLTAHTSVTGTVQSFSDLGISFSTSGQASFDSSVFNSLTGTQVADGFKFLGSATTGIGGFSSQLSQFSDPIEGLIQMETAGLKQTDLHMQQQIDTLKTRISAMQTHLTLQLEAADALQAQLQSQQQAVQAGLQAVSLVLYGKNQTQF